VGSSFEPLPFPLTEVPGADPFFFPLSWSAKIAMSGSLVIDEVVLRNTARLCIDTHDKPWVNPARVVGRIFPELEGKGPLAFTLRSSRMWL
jgi:hypothetical protein